MPNSPEDPNRLYQLLADYALQKLDRPVPSSHMTLFKPNSESLNYYQSLYVDQLHKPQNTPVKKRPADKTCQYCEKFHLSSLKNIEKTADINLGNKLEKCFQSFINQYLKKFSPGRTCVRADLENLHMPDFKILDAQGSERYFFEFKVIFRPFLKIAEKVNPDYECYSHSLTLDVSNGKKLSNQRELVNAIGVDKTAYVYWYDLPCVKGIFWMPAKRVYALHDEQTKYKRKVVKGDLDNQGQIIAAVNKIYLPLLEMKDFVSLLTEFQK